MVGSECGTAQSTYLIYLGKEGVKLHVFAPDAILDGKPRKGLGYMLYGEPDAQGRYTFGHDGAGGSLGLADSARRLSVGVAKTLLRADTTTADAILAALQEAIPVRA